MKYLKKISVLLIIFICSCSAPSNRDNSFPRFPEFKSEKFFADPIVFYEPDSLKSRIDLYIEVPVESLIFKVNNNTGNYESKITMTVNITNSTNENILTRIYNENSVYSENEIKEKSKDALFYFYNYYIGPGNYKMEVILKDNNSKIEYKKSVNVLVKDLNSREVSFSDLMILSKYIVNQDGKKEITPLISNNIFGLKEFSILFEIYNTTDKEITKECVIKLKDNKDAIIKEETLTYLLTPNKNLKVENISIGKESMKYSPEEPQFDFFLSRSEQTVSFKIEICDKTNNEVLTEKKLLFIPDKFPTRKKIHHPHY